MAGEDELTFKIQSWEEMSNVCKEMWICSWAIEHLQARGEKVPLELEKRVERAANACTNEVFGAQEEAERT
jgi:hypothetical protein